MSPVFSIIVPTFNRHSTLAACIENIDEAVKNVPSGMVEVIITDDYIANETRLFLSKYNFRSNISVVDGPKKGPAANRNNGVLLSKGEWVLFTDDDCLPDKDILKNYLAAITQYNTVSVFEGKIISDKEQTRYDEEAPVNVAGNNFWSCNVCLRKSVFNEMGGFDENFPYPYMEDIDFFVRLQNRRYEVKFVENAYVIHPWRTKRGWNAYMKCARSILYFNEKKLQYFKTLKIYVFQNTYRGIRKAFFKTNQV